MNDFNIELAEIWDELYKDTKRKSQLGELLIPTPYPEIKKTRFLCIGMNPSFSTDWWYDKIKSDSHHQGLLDDIDKTTIEAAIVEMFSTKKQINNEVRKEISRQKAETINKLYKFQGKDSFVKKLPLYKSLESIGVGKHSYFKKFDTLATALYGTTNDYMHLDLFNFKCTSSYILLRHINAVPSFFERQLGVFRKVVKEIQPDIILVANADASKIFKLMFFDNKSTNFLHKFKDGFKHNSYLDKGRNLYDPNFGFYHFQDGCKVFFSGMLSQQRALDLDSFDRLKLVLKRGI